MKKNRAKNLELITPATLIVGVDGHAKSNTAAFVLASGREPARPFRFTNNRKGFIEFLERVNWLKQKNSVDAVIFVLEPNGPYWQLLARFLLERKHTVRTVGALQVKRNRQTENPSPDKNDSRDARSAADLGRQGKFGQAPAQDQRYEDLRCLTSLREGLLEQRSAHKHRLRAALVRSFPELLDCFCDICGKGTVALLRKAATASSVVGLGLEGLEEVLKDGSRGRLGKKKAKQVWDAANDSVGYAEESRALRIEFDALLDSVAFISAQIEKIESEMKDLLCKTYEALFLLSIPGIGEISAAAILGETGGILQYDSPSQIRKLAGLDLVGQQSGEHQGNLRISKRGRRILRKILYQCAVSSLHCNPVLKRFYDGLICSNRKNRSLKKKEAIIAVAGKLVEIMHSLVKRGEFFDAGYEWMPPGESVKKAA